MERPPLERPGMGRAMSPPGIRDRSLSPRSKELQREMQAARERRVDRVDRKGVLCVLLSVLVRSGGLA